MDAVDEKIRIPSCKYSNYVTQKKITLNPINREKNKKKIAEKLQMCTPIHTYT